MKMTQHCVACYSQLQSSPRNEFSQRLLRRVNTDIFDSTELAQLYVATRQFDAALSAFEHKLLAPSEDAIDLDRAGRGRGAGTCGSLAASVRTTHRRTVLPKKTCRLLA